MGKPNASSIMSFAILPALLFTLAGPVFAQEDDVDALKAKIAALQGTVDNTMQGREYLYNELTEAGKRAEAAEAERDQLKNQNADLSKSLRFMTDTRDHLYNELDATTQTMERRLEVADNGQSFMTDRLSQVLEEKAANEASLQQQLEKVTVGRDYLAERLKTNLAESASKDSELARLKKSLTMVKRGRSYLKEQTLALTADSDKKEAEIARLKKSLTMAKRGRSYLKEQTLALTAESDKKDAEIAGLKKSLTMAKRGRSYLKEQTLALTADSDKKDAELDQMAEVSFVQINSAIAERDAARDKVAELETELDNMAEVAFAQINSAIAERDSVAEASTSNAWAVASSESLSESISDLAEVAATEDNKVSIEIGNTGIFRSGGTILTENGQNVLRQLGDVLAEMQDTHINVVGHTDNLPVGSGGRFASNAELSFARASSALLFLNRNAGIPADNLSASGLGDKYPIATNDTAEGRTANRRVEILLSPK